MSCNRREQIEKLHTTVICSLFIYGVVKHTRPWLQGVSPFLAILSSKINSTKTDSVTWGATHTAGAEKSITTFKQQAQRLSKE